VSPRYIPLGDIPRCHDLHQSGSDLLKSRLQSQVILLPDVCKKKIVTSGFGNAIAGGETKQSLDIILERKRKEKKIRGKKGGKKGGVLHLNRQARKEKVDEGAMKDSLFPNRNTSRRLRPRGSSKGT